MLPLLVVRLAVFLIFVASAAPVFAHPGPRPLDPAIHRPRYSDAKPVRLERSRGSYFVKTEIGSPGQILSLQLRNDAGAVTYVPASNASSCVSGKCTMGALDPSLSTTFRLTPDRFSWLPSTHAQIMNAEGFRFRDDIGFADLIIANFSMGIAHDLSTDSGVLGLGYPNPSSELLEDGLTWALVEQGVATTEAFSVWLAGRVNHIDTGSLLFGAIDSKKYSGHLKSIDMVYRDMSYQGPRILLSHVKASSPSGDDILMGYEDDPTPVALKLGTAFSTFPQTLAEAFWKVAGAEYIEACNCPTVPCRLSKGQGTFVYGFAGRSGPRITMYLRTMVVEEEVQDLRMNRNGEPLCAFSITNGSNPVTYSLGEDFLRNAYAVFDLHNNEVALAQARMDFDAMNNSNLVPFASHGAPIPSVRGVAGQPTVVPAKYPTSTVFSIATTTYAAASKFTWAPITSSLDSTWTSNLSRSKAVQPRVFDDTDVQPKVFNTAGDIGVAIGAVVVGVIIVGVGYTIYYHQKKLQLEAKRVQSSCTPGPPVSQLDTHRLGPRLGPPPPQSMDVQTKTSVVGDTEPTCGLAVATASPAGSSVRESVEGEPKSPSIETQTKVKSHTSEQKVLGTLADLRRTENDDCASASAPTAILPAVIVLPPE